MLSSVCLVLAMAAPAPIADEDDDIQKAVAALIEVLRHPEARGERLEQSRRAIAALTAMGKPAVPKLLDAITAKADDAAGYSALALKAMPAAQAAEAIKDRWDKAGVADRWKIVPFHKNFEFNPVAEFAIGCLDSKDAGTRAQAWGFVLANSRAHALDPAKHRYLKALAGDETPQLRWGLLVREPAFDADKEADILIGLLKPDSWVAKGEGRMPPPGGTAPEWPDGRDTVVEILGHRKVKKAVPALLALLAEKGEGKAFFGHTVIPVLGDLGDKAAIPELKRVLSAKAEDLRAGLSPPERLKAYAARALWQLGDTSGREFLKGELKHKRWVERRYAAETIARYGTKDDIPLLALALDDDDWGVLQAASEGLERITGVKNRPNNNTRASEVDAPLWKEWLKKNK